MGNHQPKPDRRKAAARWIAFVAATAGLIALGLWIAWGFQAGDDAVEQPDAATVGADSAAAAVDTYLEGLGAGDFDALLPVLSETSFVIRRGHDWWLDLLDQATVELIAQPAQQVGGVGFASSKMNLPQTTHPLGENAV